ncbi:MAG TPA: hypothetical protein VF615_30555 [Longimicrobiaceae bacterium]|jgi:beta propeller repeat protein
MHGHASPRTARLAAAALAALALAACDGGPLSPAASPDGAAPRLLAFLGTADSAVVAGPDVAAQPWISGARIAYLGIRGGNHDIYVYDLDTKQETRVSSAATMQQSPSISGHWVVYQDRGFEVRAHDLRDSTDFQISPAVGYAETEPSVSGTRVVYTSNRSTTGNTIYMYDLAANTEVPIRTFPTGTSPMPSALEPEIGGDLVVWREQWGSPRQEAIMIHDLSTGATRTAVSSPTFLSNPSTDGARVVYEDHRNGNWEIYMFDPATRTETRVTTQAAEQRNPRISGDVVVWEDYRHGNAEIYAYDLSAGTEHRVTWNAGNQLRPAISGGRIVWQDGRSYTDTDIYMRVLAGS